MDFSLGMGDPSKDRNGFFLHPIRNPTLLDQPADLGEIPFVNMLMGVLVGVLVGLWWRLRLGSECDRCRGRGCGLGGRGFVAWL